MAAWWERHLAVTPAASFPLEEAILGGFSADRVGYAFASGYEAALHALVPDLPRDRLVAFSVSERGGAHPSAIETRLTRHPGGPMTLRGHKRWTTLPGESGLL